MNKNKNPNIKPINIEINNTIREKPRSLFNLNFIVFKSVNELFYIICSSDNIIEMYDIIDNVKILDIKGSPEDKYGYGLDYYLDTKNCIDLVLSKSKNEIKIWNINELECILNINTGKGISNAFFLNDPQQCFIIVFFGDKLMNVYDLKGNNIKKVNIFKNIKKTYFICSYYDKRITKKNYIIYCGYQHLISYNFEKNSIYHNYVKSKVNVEYYHIAIFDNDDIIKLMGTNDKCFIDIWNFNSGNLIDTIKTIFLVTDIFLWDDNYLFCLCKYDPLKLIDLNKKAIVKSFGEKGRCIYDIKKIIHPIFGPSLVTLDYSGEIKLWTIKE